MSHVVNRKGCAKKEICMYQSEVVRITSDSSVVSIANRPAFEIEMRCKYFEKASEDMTELNEVSTVTGYPWWLHSRARKE